MPDSNLQNSVNEIPATPEELASLDLVGVSDESMPATAEELASLETAENSDGSMPATGTELNEFDPAGRTVSLLSKGKTYAERAKLAADNFEDSNLRPYLIKSLAGEMKARDARSLQDRVTGSSGLITDAPAAFGDAVGSIWDAVAAAGKNAKSLLYDEGGIFQHPLESTPERARAYGEALTAVQTAVYGYEGLVRKTAEAISDTGNALNTTSFVSFPKLQKTEQPNREVRTDDVYEARAEADIQDAKTMAEVITGSKLDEATKKQLLAKGPEAAIRPEEVGKLSLAYDPVNLLEFGAGAVVGASAKAVGKAVVARGLKETAEAASKPGFAARAVGSVFGAVGERVVKSSENALLVGTLTGAAAAASGADTDTVVLASILGAGGTRKSALVSSALERSGGAMIRMGDKFAGRASFGPMGRFAEGALAFARPALYGAAAGAAVSAPFVLGARDEDEVLRGVAGGAAFGFGGGLVGSAYARVADKFSIDNVFKSRESKKPDSAYERPEFTNYSPDVGHPLETESKRVFDTLSNKAAQAVEALKKLVSKAGEDGLKNEVYLGGREAADAFARAHGLDSARAGLTIDLPAEGRRVIFINADSNGGISLGHEVGHGIVESMPKAEQAAAVRQVRDLLGDEEFSALRERYAEKFNTTRDASGNTVVKPRDQWVYQLDEYYAKEYLAENFSAYLNGIPAEKFGTPRKIADRVRIKLGALLEKSGARKLTADGSAAVQTPLGYKPSAALAEMFDNFLQARKMESTSLPSEPPPSFDVPPSKEAATVAVEKPTVAPTAETISNVSEVEPKAPVEGFKKGDPIGEIRDKSGMLIAEEAKISKVLENGMYEIEFTDPDTGKRMRGTADEQSLQSPVAVGKVPAGRDVFYPSPVTTETPAGIARPETLPTPAEIVAPKQVENVARPEAPSVTKPTAPLRPEAANKFAAKASDETHRQNREALEKTMAAPRSEIPALETDYYSASSPVQSPDAVVREAQRRAADAIEKKGKPNPFRTAFQKLFVPYRWSAYKLPADVNARLYGPLAERRAGGVYGMSVDKVGQNIDLLRGLALENPKLAQVLSGKGFSDAYLTSNELISDFQKYLTNQANGFGGGGEPLKRPSDTKLGSVTEPTKGFVPAVLPIEKRQLFNLLLNYEQQGSRTVGMEYSSRFAKLNGIDPLTIGTDSKGRPLTENNALRAEAMKAGFDPRVLNSAVENLPTENFTTPLKERRDIKFAASDVGIAQAGFMPEIPEGRRVQGNEETRKIATDYIEKSGLGTVPHETYAPTNETTLKRIADFYENAKHEPDNPEVAAAYRALADETRAQYDDMVAAGIKIEPFEGKGEPYANSAAMLADVRGNKHLYFFLTDKAFGEGGVSQNNALLQKSGISINGHDLLYNDLFRAVHDYFGHTAEGFEFGPRGEYNAYLAHSRMFSEAAKPALAAETLAQNAWVNFGPQLRRTDGSLPKSGDVDFVPIAKRRFADQKNTVVPQELLQAADTNSKASFDPKNPDIRFMPEVIKREIGSNLDFANPPTDEQAVKALSSEKKIKFGRARELEEGHQVAARIDIPAFLRDGTYVVALHEPDGPSGGPGTIIGYDTVARLKNPQFVVKPRVRLIYEDKSNKFPVATVDGQIISDRSIPTDLENWVPVGMDPKEHSFFYDKRTDQPVKSGDESISVGNTVFVKNPVYASVEGVAFMPDTPPQLQSRRKLPHAIEDKELVLVHRSGSAGLETIDPSRFGKSGITPRSERSGEDRAYFYVQGYENKGDITMNRPNQYEIPVSGKRIYDGDSDALNWKGTINRQKADLMLKDAGYAGILRTVGEGKKAFKQVELYEEVKTPAREKTSDDLKDEILNSPRGEKAAERIAKEVGSSTNGYFFDAMDAWVEKEMSKKSKVAYMPEAPDTPEFRNWFDNSKVVDENGAPVVVYHGSPNTDITTFDTTGGTSSKRTTSDFNTTLGSHFSESADTASRFAEGLYSKKSGVIYPVYLNIENPLMVGQGRVPKELRASLDQAYKVASREYDAATVKDLTSAMSTDDLLSVLETFGSESKEFEKALKGSSDASGPAYQKLQQRVREIADAEKNNRPFTEEEIADLTGKKFSEIADLPTPKRLAIGRKLRSELEAQGYDGVLYSNADVDEGKGTRTWIAFRPEQIKSATGNVGTFDPKNPDIRFMPEEPLAQAIDKVDSPVESLEAAGGKINWEASFMPEIDPSAFPTMSQSILDQIKQDTDTVAAIHMDRMRVGSYKGIDLQGGMFYPTIRENLDKGVVWAFNDDKTARKVANQAAKNNGYVKLILMSEGNVIGNRTFTSIWFHDLKENIASGALKEKTALRELNRVRKIFADFTGHKTAWTNLKDAQKDITEMAQIRRGQSYFQRSKTNTKAEGEKTAYGSLLTKSMTESGFPDAVQIVSDIEEPAFKGIPQGSAVAVLRFDPVPAGSKIKTASEMGVPEHASYKYVLTGKPVAKLENYAVVDLTYPEMKNQIMTQQVTKFPAQESLIPRVPYGRITYGSELSAETARQAAPAREAPLAQEAVIKKSKPAAAPLADVTL